MAKYRKILSDRDAPHMQALIKKIETQSKATLVNWAVAYSERVLLPLWLRDYPDDQRPKKALQAARDWLTGTIRLPQAKALILACHAAARESGNNPVAQAAARAIGQSASTIHSARHCLGLPLYGALAVAYAALGINSSWRNIEEYAAEECGRMLAALEEIAVDNEPNPAKINRKC